MTTKIETQKIQIRNDEELRQKLNLGFDIYIPEFEGILELTQKDLDELKEKIIINRENKEVLEKTIREIISKKLKGQLGITEGTVAGLSGIRQKELRGEVKGKIETQTIIQNLQETQTGEINSIDVTKGIETQTKVLRTFESGLIFLLQELALKGVKKEDLIDYNKFKQIFSENLSTIKSITKPVGDKMLEIFNSNNSELKDFFTQNWQGYIERIYPQIDDINEVLDSLDSEKEISKGNIIVDFAKKHPIMAGGIAVVGVFGIFKFLFGGGENSGKKEKGKGFFSSILGFFTGKYKTLFGGLLAMFGLGQLAGMEGIKSFFKDKIGFDIDENRLTKALELFADGKFVDGISVLFLGAESLSEGKESDDFYKKLAEDINKTKYGKKVDGGIKWETIKRVGGHKTKDFLSVKDFFFRMGGNFLNPLSDKQQGKEIEALVGYMNERKRTMKLKIKDSDTVDNTLKQISGQVSTDLGKAETSGVGATEVVGAVAGGTVASGVDRGDESGENSGNDRERSLASRVSQYTTKALYFDGLADKYLKYNGIDVGGSRIKKLQEIYRISPVGSGHKGYLANIMKVEKKGGVQKLLSELQKSTNPRKIARLEREIDAYLRNFDNFERSFSTFVRNAKIKPKFFESDLRKYNDFERLKQREIQLGEEVHNLSKTYDDKIADLRTKETDPKKLAKKEAKLRKEFSEKLHGKNKKGGKAGELRKVQKKMIEGLYDLSEKDRAKFLSLNRNRYKKRVLPGGKIGLAVMGLTAGSFMLEGVNSDDFKKDLALTGGEAVGGFVPFVNVGLDLNQILSGEDLANRKLAGWERWGLAPACLVLDTVGSIATASGIGAWAGIPILAGSNALKGVKGARAINNARKVAKEAHLASGVTQQYDINKLRKAGITIIGKAKDINKFRLDFLDKYREGMRMAYKSNFLKAASPLAKVSKVGVYGSLGFGVWTGVQESVEYVIDKTSPIYETVRNFSGY